MLEQQDEVARQSLQTKEFNKHENWVQAMQRTKVLGSLRDTIDAVVYGSIDQGSAWIVCWVLFVLGPTQFLFFGFLNDFLAWVQAAGIVVAAVPNCVMLYKYHGVVKVMGFPHLFGFIPTVAFAVLRITTDLFGFQAATLESNPGIFGYALAIIIVDGISILFDLVDSIIWFKQSPSERTVVIGRYAKRRLGLNSKYPDSQVVPVTDWLTAIAEEQSCNNT